MRVICILGFILLQWVAYAQQTPVGEQVIDYSKIKFLNTDKTAGSIHLVGKFDKTNPQQTLFKITTHTQPKFIYHLSATLPLQNRNYAKGNVFLVSFEAKTEKASLETGEAKVLWMLKQSKSHKTSLARTVSLASEWKTYYIPFVSTQKIEGNQMSLVMQFGYRPQSFLIKNISFKTFPLGTKLADLPKTKITYAGMEADAQWRKEALNRIEKNRKSDFAIRFVKNGKPLAKQKIAIKLIKHQFGFGAALDAADVVENTLEYQQFKNYFNEMVFENDLKIKKWKRVKRKNQTLKALQILKEEGVKVKGHVLVWPGFNYLTPEFKKHQNNPKKITNMMNNHVKDILKETEGLVSHWDVVNEAYTNKDLQQITGSEKILYNTFRIVKKTDPNVGRFTNEYGIISKGGIDTQKQEWYYNYIKRIDKATGGLVQGIGIQSHIGSDLTPPKRVLEILDYYGQLNKKISISEFTMDVQDAEVRAQYTRDFLIAAFSHPKVSEFLFWGCMEDERNKVDIFTKDGSLGVMGVVYDNLRKQWNTHFKTKTNTNGVVKANGFYGIYEYTLIEKGKEVKGTFELKPNQQNTFTINLK